MGRVYVRSVIGTGSSGDATHVVFLARIPEYPSKATTKVTGHYEEELLFSDLFSIWLMVQNSEYWTCEIPLVPHDIPKIITFFE